MITKPSVSALIALQLTLCMSSMEAYAQETIQISGCKDAEQATIRTAEELYELRWSDREAAMNSVATRSEAWVCVSAGVQIKKLWASSCDATLEDTQIEVYPFSGNCADVSRLCGAIQDGLAEAPSFVADNECGLQSDIQWDVDAGRNYLIRVWQQSRNPWGFNEGSLWLGGEQ